MATAAKYDFKPYAYGFQKDSPFLAMFNYYINEMKEKGSLEQIQAQYEPAPQVCPDYRWKSQEGTISIFSFVTFTSIWENIARQNFEILPLSIFYFH